MEFFAIRPENFQTEDDKLWIGFLSIPNLETRIVPKYLNIETMKEITCIYISVMQPKQTNRF